MAAGTDQVYRDNLRLGRLEYQQRHVYLYSRPRCLGLVLGNACNIHCIHCYQAKNGDTLFGAPAIGDELRRELMAFYPYVSTLRILGGEVFAIPGFRELIEDLAALVSRPVLSISTNGTLIDEAWAERLVRTPFSNVTISIDGGTRATYNRIRAGADLDHVLANIDRIQRWKAKLGSDRPYLDSFFVIMRSNFREIPQYLELMHRHGMLDVSLQTMELSPENVARVPNLAADEAITEPSDIRALHAILEGVWPRARKLFRMVRVSGLQTLFEAHRLSAAFLDEGEKGLYPDSEGLCEGAFDLCPNPWTTLFVAENGDAYLCFLAQPVGNLYAEPLAALWNSPGAIANRSGMISGRYLASGCSRQYCAWREGRSSPRNDLDAARREWRELVQADRFRGREAEAAITLAPVRRLLAEERRKRIELELRLRSLESLLESGQKHADHLEGKAQKAVADFRDLEAAFHRYRAPWLVRAAHRASQFLRWRGATRRE